MKAEVDIHVGWLAFPGAGTLASEAAHRLLGPQCADESGHAKRAAAEQVTCIRQTSICHNKTSFIFYISCLSFIFTPKALFNSDVCPLKITFYSNVFLFAIFFFSSVFGGLCTLEGVEHIYFVFLFEYKQTDSLLSPEMIGTNISENEFNISIDLPLHFL